jgi:hypothetical protein
MNIYKRKKKKNWRGIQKDRVERRNGPGLYKSLIPVSSGQQRNGDTAEDKRI